MQNIDVLVVGAGPTGLTMGLELAAQGVQFRVIEQAAERSPYSRALVIHPRSQELLDRHDDVRKLIAKGTQAPGVTLCINGAKVAAVDLNTEGLTTTRFHSPVQVAQTETEEFLESALRRRYGATVEMGTSAKSIRQDADGVTVVTVRRDGTEETIRAKYVVGADGAHSVVRHAAKDLTFDGEAYPQEFILTDAHIRTDVPVNRIHVCLGKGFLLLLPMKDGVVRLVVARAGDGGRQKEGDPTLADFQEFLPGIFPGEAELYDPVWLARFHLHHRGVSNYRQGRLFVAGDAAHIHSPVGGQGMNTGIQDAVNLGWKLGAALRGDSAEKDREVLLNSYNVERHPVGRHLLTTTDAGFSWITWDNPIYLFLRGLILPWILPFLVGNRNRVRQGLRFITQFGIHYGHSPIVGTAPGFASSKGRSGADIIRGGSRAIEGTLMRSGSAGGDDENEVYLQQLLTPESHHLVLFSGLDADTASEGDLRRAETEFSERTKIRAKVHTVFSGDRGTQAPGYVDVGGKLHDAYGFKGPGYVLVRPDGYVAHIGPLSSFGEFLSWFH
ncbi:FAD binding domain-containing protein [Xylariales sp. PMI_506]|nr:FAD binding domain-containing protein [Xylariales sp. PMI_506]